MRGGDCEEKGYGEGTVRKRDVGGDCEEKGYVGGDCEEKGYGDGTVRKRDVGGDCEEKGCGEKERSDRLSRTGRNDREQFKVRGVFSQSTRPTVT